MIFLYNSYSSLKISNETLKAEANKIEDIQKIKKVIYLDFSLALYNSVTIINRDNDEDFVSMQTSNSIHRRFNPYVTYIVKDKKLYRLESLKKIDKFEIASDAEFEADYIGEVENFRLYRSNKKDINTHLIDIRFSDKQKILYKIKALNEY